MVTESEKTSPWPLTVFHPLSTNAPKSREEQGRIAVWCMFHQHLLTCRIDEESVNAGHGAQRCFDPRCTVGTVHGADIDGSEHQRGC